MHYNIDFPHLGIFLKHVGKTISIGSFDINYYGIAVAAGILAGMLIVFALAARSGQKTNDYENLALFGIVFGIIGARAYYVIFSWDDYRGDIRSILNIREGGLAIYGGVIAAFLTVFIYTRVRRLSFLQVADTVCVGFAAGQMIGRWGNFFNREAFGEYTDRLFAMRLPVDAVRAGDITDKMRGHITSVGGVRMIQVHPTFLYESVWCMILLIVLLVLHLRGKDLFRGQIFLTYLGGYALARVFIEGLRTDQLQVRGIPVSQVLSGVLAAVCWGIIIVKRLARRGKQ